MRGLDFAVRVEFADALVDCVNGVDKTLGFAFQFAGGAEGVVIDEVENDAAESVE